MIYCCHGSDVTIASELENEQLRKVLFHRYTNVGERREILGILLEESCISSDRINLEDLLHRHAGTGQRGKGPGIPMEMFCISHERINLEEVEDTMGKRIFQAEGTLQPHGQRREHIVRVVI